MKRIFLIIALALALAVPSSLWAAGSCTQTLTDLPASLIDIPQARVITLACTGSGDDGSIPNTAISAANADKLAGFYLYTITAYPTSGGTAPDAADVFILDANGEDLLGSVDGGTTANKGLNLIHATLKKTTMPYSHYLSAHYYPGVTGALTLKVLNQATVSANYTIELLFAR
jgi:hypothetical protein